MKFTPWLGIAGAVALACLAFGATYKYSGSVPAHFFSEAVAAVPASSHVKVVTGGGHGSGTHIGNGYMLTAAHVIRGAETVEILADNGTKYQADVLWSNTAYDLALIRLQESSTLATTVLNCAPNFAGQRIKAFGNPQVLDSVYTLGEVIGGARQHGPWASVAPVDMTVIPGMSGGGVLNEAGELVGITVGVMAQFQGLTGIGYVVPAASACELMGRAA